MVCRLCSRFVLRNRITHFLRTWLGAIRHQIRCHNTLKYTEHSSHTAKVVFQIFSVSVRNLDILCFLQETGSVRDQCSSTRKVTLSPEPITRDNRKAP